MNAFESVILKLQLPENRTNHWARAVIASWKANKERLALPHYQSQILEDSIFEDLSFDFGISAEELRSLDYHGGEDIQELKGLIEHASALRPEQRVALSCILSSISRFKLSDDVLRSAENSGLCPEDQVHACLQRFALDNRMGISVEHESIFRKIFRIIDDHGLGAAFILKAAAPAIVWSFKGQRFSQEFYEWLSSAALRAADELASTKSFDELMLLSHFWRAMAMDPASKGDQDGVREMMSSSRTYAEAATPRNELEECRKTDALKTYLESTVKEHLYCTRDLTQAQKASLDLVTLDPEWPISRLEAAEVAFAQGQPLQALNQLAIASRLGGPRKTVSLFYQAHALELLDRYQESIEIYGAVLDRDPTCISALENLKGLSRAKGFPLSSRAKFLHQEYEARGLLVANGEVK